MNTSTDLIKLISHIQKQPLDKGFTLIELLVTMIMVGILSAVALPSLRGQIDKSRYAEAKIQMSTIAIELETYNFEKGYFPPDVFPNQIPSGINYFPQTADGTTPFNSQYDYESWEVNSNQCYIQITFFGKDSDRESPTNTQVYPEPGIYEHPSGDDLLYVVGTYDQLCQ